MISIKYGSCSCGRTGMILRDPWGISEDADYCPECFYINSKIIQPSFVSTATDSKGIKETTDTIFKKIVKYHEDGVVIYEGNFFERVQRQVEDATRAYGIGWAFREESKKYEQKPSAPPSPPPKANSDEAASMARLMEILAGFDPHKIKS